MDFTYFEFGNFNMFFNKLSEPLRWPDYADRKAGLALYRYPFYNHNQHPEKLF